MRLINRRQFLPEDDPKHLKKIKSVLNYIKKTMYPIKVDYEQSHYAQIICPIDTDDVIHQGEWDARYQEAHTGLAQSEIELYLKDLPRTLRKLVDETPYAKDRVVENNLYITCLISFLNTITFNNKRLAMLSRYKDKTRVISSKQIQTYYELEQQDAITLFNLPETMTNYVKILLTRFKKIVVRDIEEIIQAYDLTDDVMKDLLVATLEAANMTGGDDD